MSLGRLIEHKESWHGPTAGEEETVKTEVSGHMIADPVLATADLGKRYGAVDSISNDCELLPVQADALIPVFEVQLSSDLGHVKRDQI